MKVMVAIFGLATLAACASPTSRESARLTKEYRAGRITSAQYNAAMRDILIKQAARHQQAAAETAAL